MDESAYIMANVTAITFEIYRRYTNELVYLSLCIQAYYI